MWGWSQYSSSQRLPPSSGNPLLKAQRVNSDPDPAEIRVTTRPEAPSDPTQEPCGALRRPAAAVTRSARADPFLRRPHLSGSPHTWEALPWQNTRGRSRSLNAGPQGSPATPGKSASASTPRGRDGPGPRPLKSPQSRRAQECQRQEGEPALRNWGRRKTSRRARQWKRRSASRPAARAGKEERGERVRW